MRGIKHPLTGDIYDVDEQGRIAVVGAAGSGLFTVDGRWISGDVRVADAHLCCWLGSERGENRFRAADQ